MDSVSARGMTSALRDADYLSAAVIEGLGGSRPLDAALRDHRRRRDRAIRGMYDFTLRLAALSPVTSRERRFRAGHTRMLAPPAAAPMSSQAQSRLPVIHSLMSASCR